MGVNIFNYFLFYHNLSWKLQIEHPYEEKTLYNHLQHVLEVSLCVCVFWVFYGAWVSENRTDEANRRKKKRKVAKIKEIEKAEIISDEMKDSSDRDIEAEEKQRSKLRKLKRKGKKTKKSEIEKVNDSDHEVEGSNLQNGIY